MVSNISDSNLSNASLEHPEALPDSTQAVAVKYFALMRVAAHDKNGNLTEEGIKRTLNAVADLERLAKQRGAREIRIVHSGGSSAEQMIDHIFTKCSLPSAKTSIICDPRLEESCSGRLLKKLKKENPSAYEAFSKLSPEEKFEAKPIEGSESGREMFIRMNAAIQRHLDAADDKTLTVFITHQSSMLNWMRGLGEKVSADWRKHHATSAEIYPMQMVNERICEAGKKFRPKLEAAQ